VTVEIYKNFYNNECLNFINETIDKSKNTANLRASYPSNNWHPTIIQDSAPVLIYDISNTELLNKNLKNKIDLEGDAVFLLYYWPTGSYIPWHDDGHYKRVGTFYCNSYWNLDWGGAFLYKDDDKILAEYPEYNKLVIQKDNTWHSTTPVTKPYYYPIDWDNERFYLEWQKNVTPIIRTTIQIFMDKDDTKNSN